MNKWIQKSIDIANSPGYLDKLHKIYPVIPQEEREIPIRVKEELKNSYYDEQDRFRLIRSLLKLKKFPVDDPYVGFLRKKDIFLEYNPQTTGRIIQRVRSMGFEAMMEGIEEPKKVSRQSGALFRNWLPKLGYPLLPESEFEKYKGIVFLQGSNGVLKDYANRALYCNLSKGLDLVAKVGTGYGNRPFYVIGEAKFITAIGGGQGAQFEETLGLLRGENGNATRIAILDGVVWIKDGTKMHRTVSQLEETALTALLLKEFLKSLEERSKLR